MERARHPSASLAPPSWRSLQPNGDVTREEQPLRLLLVEDNPAHAELIRRAFEARGEFPAITIARTIAEARKKLSAAPTPDLLITDWRLPDGDGVELLRDPLRRTFPAIVMTGHGDQRTGVRAMKAGALDYVIKSAAAFEAMPQIVKRTLREWALIEERRRLEEELRAAQRTEAIGQLAGGIAHDFNNVLTIIGTHLELIGIAAPDDPMVQDSLGEINKAYESASSLTRQMLAVGGKQVVDPTVMGLNESVETVSAMLGRVIGEEYEIDLRLGDEPAAVEVEPTSFEQVIINLMMNARDAMGGGGRIVLEVDVLIAAQPIPCVGGLLPPGRYGVLRVQDFGTGIPPEIMQRMFDPFFTTKPRGRGTGLGLPSALGIIRQSGGDVRVDSVVGEGTTFHVYLPLAATTPDSIPSPIPAVLATARGPETIRVAEAEPGLRSLCQRILTERGYTVITAQNGEEAVTLLKERGPEIDLVVTDVVMPKMSGTEVAEWLRREGPEMPILFVSGYVDDRLSASWLTHAHTKFLPKPFTPRSLGAAVRELLDQDVSAVTAG